MKEYMNPKNASGFMTFFAYLGSLSGYSFILLSITLVVATLTDKNKYDKLIANWKVRLSVIGVYLVTIALISTALYVAFTAVRSVEIAGVQFRYLIPLVFPLLFILGSSRITMHMNRNIYNTAIFSIMAFVLLQGIWELIIKLHY